MIALRLASAVFLILGSAGAWAAGPVISEILIRRGNIFDPSIPKESALPYRLTNSLHRITQEGFIERELLFKVGDPCDAAVFMEAERKLRATGLLNPVSITSTLLPDGTCRVEVRTRDVWTTKPGVTFSSYSGKTKWSAELEESNLLGYGKNLLFSYLSDVDQHRYLMDYMDPQFLHPTWHLETGIFKTSEGNGFNLSLAQPFDVFTVREAFTAAMQKNRQIIYDYWEGKKSFSFISLNRQTTLNYGQKVWERGDSLLRLTAGYQRIDAYQLPAGVGKKVDEQRPGSRDTGQLAACRRAKPDDRDAVHHHRSGSRLNTPGETQTATQVASVQIEHGINTGNLWFDASNFLQPTGVAFGTTGRNIMSGPGLFALNLSLFKNFGSASGPTLSCVPRPST